MRKVIWHRTFEGKKLFHLISGNCKLIPLSLCSPVTKEKQGVYVSWFLMLSSGAVQECRNENGWEGGREKKSPFEKCHRSCSYCLSLSLLVFHLNKQKQNYLNVHFKELVLLLQNYFSSHSFIGIFCSFPFKRSGQQVQVTSTWKDWTTFWPVPVSILGSAVTFTFPEVLWSPALCFRRSPSSIRCSLIMDSGAAALIPLRNILRERKLPVRKGKPFIVRRMRRESTVVFYIVTLSGKDL